ncbi:protein STICHEL [Sesbania bispinosa]|nr:protein STICHEL [Sesbania bispinosa]
MSEMRVSDPSKLHLKKELTQIRKAARVLRDPGTTSSWKSPLSSSRSVAAWKDSGSRRFSGNGNTQLDSGMLSLTTATMTKRKRRGCSCTTGRITNRRATRVELLNTMRKKKMVDLHRFWEVFEDSLSDARNGCDSKSDGGTRSSIFRCGDANLVSLGTPAARRTVPIKEKEHFKEERKQHTLWKSNYLSKTPENCLSLPQAENFFEECSRVSIGTGRSDDELSTNFGELDLEGLSRLDGREGGHQVVGVKRDWRL